LVRVEPGELERNIVSLASVVGNPLRWRHPERSRFSGVARDLAWSATTVRARSLGPLVKARTFGMTPVKLAFKFASAPRWDNSRGSPNSCFPSSRRRDRGDRRTIRKRRGAQAMTKSSFLPTPQKQKAAVQASSRGIWDIRPFLCRRRALRTDDGIPCRCTRRWAWPPLLIESYQLQ
jgi:hypothetical protein